MARVGIDAATGQVLSGWPHCAQSIRTILSTAFRERFQRRYFGSSLPDLIDRPQNEETILDIYMAAAEALEPRVVEGHQCGEPGFVLLRTILDASESGKVSLLLSGVFFEDGHLGDYSNPALVEVAYTVSST